METRIGLVNYRTEIHKGEPFLVSHWIIGSGADAERISAATKIHPELTDEQTLEVVKMDLKAQVARKGKPIGDGTELEPQRG